MIPALLRSVGVPEEHRQIFQSHAAALEEVKRNDGVAPTVSFVIAQDPANGSLVRVAGLACRFDGVWAALSPAERDTSSAAAELIRFVTNPRATQAMPRGPGVDVGRFRPSVHVTLWSQALPDHSC
ncbi:hypothetical protein [Streptosporangium vulgare]|uniref:Uncharacterized protein n=1 Tax=Streptosporangium vulgare TaxID=46190 RepID=A0ABV5THZ9_9ACTN